MTPGGCDKPTVALSSETNGASEVDDVLAECEEHLPLTIRQIFAERLGG